MHRPDDKEPFSPPIPTRDRDVVIVGAGMAGLMAARELRARGRSVVLVDKGRRPGGRLATRRVRDALGPPAVCDSGAQFFTVRDDTFGRHVDHWLAEGWAQEWCRGFGSDDGHIRYRGRQGMKTLGLRLAEGMEVIHQTRVEAVAFGQGRWQVAADGATWTASAVILTPPVPQSLDLVDAGGIELPYTHRRALESIAYEPCLAALARLDGPSGLPDPGGLAGPTGDIAWIADNQRKGISPEAVGVTIHASADFTREHLDGDRDQAGRELVEQAMDLLGRPPTAVYVHLWRYSKPTSTFARRHLAVDVPAPLVFAGDAFGGPRIEGAAMSGLSAADQLASEANGT